tara:strand:+ start:622 stop:870 length:249 start_codon:yes stop_codon:yes gene_type:complete
MDNQNTQYVEIDKKVLDDINHILQGIEQNAPGAIDNEGYRVSEHLRTLAMQILRNERIPVARNNIEEAISREDLFHMTEESS